MQATNSGSIHNFLSADHLRLDALLARACREEGRIDIAAFDAFRAGLLEHIAMEEKILLPVLRKAEAELPPIVERLRLDHGVFAALLVPTPTRRIADTLRSILAAHNHLEEDAGGLYEACDQLAGVEADRIVARLRAQPRVPVSAYNDGPRVMLAICRVLERAGYTKEAEALKSA